MVYSKIKCVKGSVKILPSRSKAHMPAIELKKGEEKSFEEFADYSCYAQNIANISLVGVLSEEKAKQVASTDEVLAASRSKKKVLDKGVESEAEQRLIEKERVEAEQKAAAQKAEESKQKAEPAETHPAKADIIAEQDEAKASKKKQGKAKARNKPVKSREEALKELEG